MNPDSSCRIENGIEVNSPEPKFDIVETQDTELDRIRQLVRQEMSQVAEKHGYETWEEANDFGPEDEPFVDAPETKYMSEEYINPRPPDSPVPENVDSASVADAPASDSADVETAERSDPLTKPEPGSR